MVVDQETDMQLVWCVAFEENDACCRIRSVLLNIASIMCCHHISNVSVFSVNLNAIRRVG